MLRTLASLCFVLLLAAPAAAESDADATAKAHYLPLEPSFVVNLRPEGRRVHFMQVSVQVMTRDQQVASAIESNLPPVRDALILLLADQSRETMTHVEGRERVRGAAQAAVQEVLMQVAGIDHGVEAIYFTDFVVQ